MKPTNVCPQKVYRHVWSSRATWGHHHSRWQCF